ncbi:FGGY-family carbohydrate kinase [Phycicoccus flavus]|uniref:FGGY-family carbohydrate kinase n=1 Tax=Phycicoccus flavus TaxID=2502783 RepID=UPI001EFF2A02|nr:FGGY-family carbohydrate kinase [Phycicoccus flavus]
MSRGVVLAVDNGSQSTKVSVVNAEGRVLAQASRPLHAYDVSVPGRVVHPGDDLWDSVVAACGAAVAAYGRPEEIVAVGLCTIRYCRALLDERGGLVEPVMSWMDPRVAGPFDAAADPRVRWVTTSSGYVTHRFTGRFVDTRANYAGAWPVDQETADWSEDPADYVRTGLPREMLFDLVSPGERLGVVTEAASAATGVPAGVPVVATANDKAVEALGCGLRSPDTVLLSLGTYIASMTVGTSPFPRDDSHWVNFGSAPGEYLYESGGIRRGMWTVSWFRDLVAGGLPPGVRPEAVLDDEAAAVPAGCGGLVALLDWLAPPDAPWRRGALLGFDGSQGRGAIHRAILEGIAMTMARHVEAMERGLGRSFSTVLVSGGGARSDVMTQVVADVLRRPARRTAFTDAAGLGAAVCAAVGVGLHPGFDAAVDAMVREGSEVAPGPDAAVYRDLRPRYDALLAHTDPLLRALQGLDPSAEARVP